MDNKLSRQAREFIEAQNIPLSKIFNASGLSKSEYSKKMKALDCYLAFGVTPCKESGHSLRTRHGHCVLCNTAVLAFTRRYSESGYVYIAWSEEIQLSKIGTCSELKGRLKNLNSQNYGGASDWIYIFSVFIENSARVEFSIGKKFKKYQTFSPHIKTGKTILCQELFSCAPSVIKKELQKVIKKNL